MSFYVFSKGTFAYPHENAQCQEILDFLKSVYLNDPDEYCYCLLNDEYHHADGSVRGQYDILVFTSHSISILEMKAKTGTLVGHPDKNYGNQDLQLFYPEGGTERISLSQVEDQQKHLKERLVNHFRKAMKKPEDHKYRIDGYLLFNDPLNLDQFSIENDQLRKWLKVKTLSVFKNDWLSINHRQPFTLTEGDICYLAERCFRLHEVDSTCYETDVTSVRKRIEAFIAFESESIYKAFDYDMIRREVLERISESEFAELLSMRKTIQSLNEEQRARYRMITEKLKVPYLSYTRLNNFFLGEILSRLKSIVETATSAFTTMPDAVKNIDISNPIVPKLTKINLHECSENMASAIADIEQLLWDYEAFYEDKYDVWGKLDRAGKSSQKAALLIDICQKMEPFHE